MILTLLFLPGETVALARTLTLNLSLTLTLSLSRSLSRSRSLSLTPRLTRTPSLTPKRNPDQVTLPIFLSLLPIVAGVGVSSMSDPRFQPSPERYP